MISKALEIENNDFEDTLQYLSAKSAALMHSVRYYRYAPV
jgi:hypothetical protein